MVENSRPTLITALLDPACYDHPTSAIEVIETHISWVLLTGTYAYKVKKPVNFGFLDFSTLDKRRFYCEEEIRLNRRFAPRLYLDVTPISGTPEKPVLGGAREAFEFAVRMLQFPQHALLDRMLANGQLSPVRTDQIAREVARFHATIASSPATSGSGSPEAVQRPVLQNFMQIGEQIDTLHLNALQAWSMAEFDRICEKMAARKEEGYIRECHGDLHLGNMAWIDSSVTLFDCIEFSPDLRWIDVMSDAAFVVMDLHDKERPDLAQRFLNSYLEQTGDFSGLAVLNYYLVYRAMVRAKVASIRTSQPHLQVEQTQSAMITMAGYLKLATEFTQPRRPWLLITHGLSGSGKTTASQMLLEHSNAIRVRSDVERKRLYGLSPQQRSRSDLNSGIYSADAHLQTYRHLEQRAREILQAGYPVIVDAAFLKQSERKAFQNLALALQVPFLILHLQADEATLRQRIADRQMTGDDVSEATLQVLELQLQRNEELTSGEAASAWVLHTGQSNTTESSLQKLARQLMDDPDKICQD